MSVSDEFSAVIARLSNQFALEPLSPHGPAHWMRVRKNGLMLAQETGASVKVIELFAIFHDSCRWNDDRDPDHGKRGADLAIRYHRSGDIYCTDEELSLLVAACEGHTAGTETNDITIATCWDADRLDLPRVGIEVNPDRLMTDVARQSQYIEEARSRAMEWVYKQRSLLHDDWELSEVRKFDSKTLNS